MIPLNKLAKLAPRHRMRKSALLLGELERELMRGAASSALAGYAAGLAKLIAAESQAPEALRACASSLVAAGEAGAAEAPELLRAVDALRHALLSETGQSPADWDLIDPRTGMPDQGSRLVHPGMRAYLEDLRSPFNVGAVFRTADAFGLEELLLSPCTADPGHPRAERSAMGAVGLVGWRRVGQLGTDPASPGSPGSDPLAGLGPAFALELGGTPIGEFDFPERGVAILGSEELGVSPQALARCELGAVSIPMAGAKGSLNASVAFGILMFAWSSSLGAKVPQPR